MNNKQKQLEDRLDSIIGKAFDLLALRNNEEVAQKLLDLFSKATSIKAKLNEEARYKPDELEELKQAAAMSKECSQEFEAAINEKERELFESKKHQSKIANLASLMYETLAELKGIESLITTQKLLQQQIIKLQDHLSVLTKDFGENWKAISSSTFETTHNESLQQTKLNLMNKVQQKEQELEAIQREEPRVTGEYKSLRERYIVLLEKQNQRKFQQIKNFEIQKRAIYTNSRTSNLSQSRQPVEKGSIQVRFVKEKPNNQIEYAIAMVFLLVSICLTIGYFWK